MPSLARHDRVVLVLAFVAIAIVFAYAAYLAPDWDPGYQDQQQYLALARGLVERGEYTRASGAELFIPEPLHPPGYPLFLAPLCLGGCDHWRIAIAQAVLFGALVLLAYEIAIAALPRRRATLAVLLIACYAPIAYFAALALSDFLAVFLLVASLAAFLRARRISSVAWGLAAGALLGWLALTRAAYVLFPGMLALVVLLIERRGVLRRRVLAPMLALAIAFVLVLVPLFAYSAQHFGRVFASSSGSAVWLGAVQGLSESDLDDYERAELAGVRADVTAFDAVTDRVQQADAWVQLNVQLGIHGQRMIAHDPLGYAARTPLRTAILWAGDLPVPSDLVTEMPGALRAAIGAVQLVLFVFGVVGAIALTIARRRTDAALLPLAVILYVTLVGIPLGTEARYALAAKPFLLIAAVAGFNALRRVPARDARL